VATDVSWADGLVEGRRTAHEFVRESLRRAILRGDLTGGSRLIQGELAATLNVSTTPVREALRDLATEGLITLDQHRGGTVRELDWDDMEEIGMVRQALDPLAARLFCERITDAQLDEAERAWQQMEQQEDPGTWVELNMRFHFIFHEATGVGRLVGILKGLEQAAGLYVAQAQRWHPEIRRRANAQHQALIEVCRERDLGKVIEVMEGHATMALEMTDPGERRSP
jgi:DNA-binding GntR family transcriptional regulator